MERLMDEMQYEINRSAEELALCQREEEERVDRKDEERSQKSKKCKRYESVTESDSEAEGSDNGFEYPVEEVGTSEEDSDAAEEKERMKSDDDEELLDVASDEDDEETGSDESTSSDDSQVSPATPGSDYSAQYEEEENWSYDEEDF
ncbi:glutamic acid-rich protein-like [Papaver somniferum]|uniref:glutamic acid-rich protein-like n=1 Tax=Papaver somniferum TaxID=3469 RepID=UPI000E6FFD8B|nr:glutamic acid-rich protein-like [Papaver somniferum]